MNSVNIAAGKEEGETDAAKGKKSPKQGLSAVWHARRIFEWYINNGCGQKAAEMWAEKDHLEC